MLIRLQKFLSDAGVASRRKAEEYILAGRVSVNGAAVRGMGAKVGEGDYVSVDGKRVDANRKPIYIMLHKPEGYITTNKDQFGRPSVMDLLDLPAGTRVFPVGRLDYDTSGLLLLTNDGGLTYKLTHPKHRIDKVYHARIKGIPTEEELEKFRGGLKIDGGGKTAPAKIEIVKREGTHCNLKIIIREGKNRQVRRMLEAIGYNTGSLKRVATGKLFLGDLAKGKYRHLTGSEVKYLKEL